ncbi:hypothetical protein PP175_13110 [Aneurinibacillus sp. Ricciae_BoGa-3]|nr:hypothetical protein [Aneurinibacillus sp. Ricciae_BoGa-3]WCK52397.1 hypothetical protein PP175_13110 [Aneurinibacillus sp. Ricciae_BoGa-3]
MITCETCGKFTDGQEIGTHWVCEDCKVDSQKVDTEESPTIQ